MFQINHVNVRFRDLALLFNLLDDIHDTLDIAFGTPDDNGSKLGNELNLCVTNDSSSAIFAGVVALLRSRRLWCLPSCVLLKYCIAERCTRWQLLDSAEIFLASFQTTQ